MTRMHELERMRVKVASDWQRVEALEAAWLVPALAFVSGLFVPPVTGSRSLNPVRQTLVVAGSFAVRALRFAVFRNVWKLLHSRDTSGPVADARTQEAGQ